MSHKIEPATLRIRCTKELIRKFKKIAVDYDNYEKTLIMLISMYEKFYESQGKYGKFREIER